MRKILIAVLAMTLLATLSSCAGNGKGLNLNLLSSNSNTPAATEQKLAFTPSKGKIANEIAAQIPSTDCKKLNAAFYDAGDAVVEILNYSKDNKQSLSPEQQQGLKAEARRYMSIVTATRKEDKKRCA